MVVIFPMKLEELTYVDRFCKVKGCHGAICVSGHEVQCEKCGAAQPDHPLLNGYVKEVPQEVNIPPLPYNEPPMDRLVRAEKELALIRATVNRIESRLNQKK